MNSLLQHDAPVTEYIVWKRQREQYIHSIKDELLNMQEIEIVNFFISIENEIKRLINEAKTDSETLHCFQMLSILYYFQRNQDITHSMYIEILKKFKTSNRLIANAMTKIFYWLAIDSNEAGQAFKELLDYVKKLISNEPNMIYHCLVILKRIYKLSISFEVIQIIFNNLQIFIDTAASDDAECQEIALKLLEFQFTHVSDEDLKPKIPIFEDQAKKLWESNDPSKLYCSIKFIYFLTGIQYSLLFSDLDNLLNRIQSMNNSILNASFSLILKQLELFGFAKVAINIRSLFSLFYKRIKDFLYPELIFEQLLKLDYDSNNPFPIDEFLEFIYNNSQNDSKIELFIIKRTKNTFTYNNNKQIVKYNICLFSFLELVFKRFPEIDNDKIINPEKLLKKGSLPCKHFIRCINLNRNLLTNDIIEYFNDPLSNERIFSLNSPKGKEHNTFVENSLRLYPIIPQLFNQYTNLLKRLHYISSITTDRKLRKQIIIIYSLFDSKEAIELLIQASLTDQSEKNRLLALSFIPPTPFVATHSNIFQYFSDSSFIVRRRGIKLISKLYDYNPLFFKPLIVDYLQYVFILLVTTLNIDDASDYASLLATVSKHCKFILEDVGYMIIATCLKVIRSSATENERQFVFHQDNSIINQSISNDNIHNTQIKHQSIDQNFLESLPKSPIFQNSDDLLYPSLHMDSKQINIKSSSISTENSGSLNHPNHEMEYYDSKPSVRTSNFITKFCFNELQIPELLIGEKRSLKEPNKSKLFLLFYSHLIDERDSYLLKALSNLGSCCEPYLVEILETYSHVFSTRNSEDLLINAIKSLTKLSLSTYNGLNIRLRCPQIAAPLVQILSTTSNEKLAISIIQLFGSAFDSVDILLTQSLTSSTDLSAVLAHSPSYGTDLAITNIIKYMGEPTLTMLKTLALIVEGDPLYSVKFLPKIALVFQHLIRKGSEMVKNQAFQYLEAIVSNTIRDFVPLLPLFLPDMQNYLELEGCVHFCTLVSYFMKADFTECSINLYFQAIDLLSKTTKISLFNDLMSFITSMIIHQHHSFDVLIKVLEHIPKSRLNSKTIPTILHLIISILQSMDMSNYTSRLVVFAMKLFHDQCNISDSQGEKPQRNSKTNTLIVQCITEFLATLVAYLDYSLESFEIFLEINKIQYKNIDQLRSTYLNRQKTVVTNPKTIKYIRDYRIKFSVSRSFIRLQTEHFFIDMEYPNELHIAVWLKNLLRIIVTKSPNPSVRACSDFLNMKIKFIKKLLPIAFLSCWKKANVADRDHFSKVVDYVLHNHRNVNNIFFEFIQIADKALIPMKVDLIKVAELSSSHQNTMFLLQKKMLNEINYQKGIQHKDLLKMMINVCIKMGRLSTARGILKRVNKSYQNSFFNHTFNSEKLSSDIFDTMDLANWSGEFGNWSKALKIYQSINAPLTYTIHSLNNLNRYDEIIKYEKEFQNMDEEDKMNVIDDFFWPYHLMKETEKLNEVVNIFEKNWTLPRILNVIYINIYNQNYERAKELIVQAYKMLVKHVDEYIAGDQNQIENDQDTAEILVECQEVVNYKMQKSSSGQTTSFFMRRVKHFKRSRAIWERTIALRDIVVPISSNLQFYIKIISELRKAKYFSLIDYYFTKRMIYNNDPNVFIQFIKVCWERGNRADSCDFLECICNMFYNHMRDPRSFAKIKNPLILSNCIYKYCTTSSFNKDLQFFLKQETGINNFSINQSEFWEKYDMISNEKKISIYEKIAEKFNKGISSCIDDVINSEIKNIHFISSACRLTGDYLLVLHPHDKESLKKSASLFKYALDLEPNRPKLWRRWAYANSSLFSAYHDTVYKNNDTNVDDYSMNAINGFLKLIDFFSEDSLEFASQIFYILSLSSPNVTSIFKNIKLPPTTVIQILPLITAKLDHPDKNLNSLIENLLTETGISNFQEIYFALNLYVSNNEFFDVVNKTERKSITAKSIIDKIKPFNIEAAADSELFIDGLIRSAMTWFEIWMHSIEETAKFPKNAHQILHGLFASYQRPKCDLDRLFIKLYDSIIQQCMRNYEASNDRIIWMNLKGLYNSLKERVNKLLAIFLSKISETLCNKRGFAINAPGHNDLKIQSIEPVLDVLETQQHPRCMVLNTVNGQKLKYLLKGNEDLRLDERLMQLFALINGILGHCENTYFRENNIFISRYAVIPLTKNVGIIQWVTGADTLHQIVIENRQLCGINREIEAQIITPISDVPFIMLNSIQRLEIYEEVAKETKGQELFEAMWLKSPNAAVWMTRTQRFTSTSALMSMVGHIIGLGDRHPSNIMIQRETGNIVHIDFGEAFDKASLRKQFPERVPFRLTRMFINALEGSIETGLFLQVAKDIMKVLRDNKKILTGQLTIFVEEPLTYFQKDGGENPEAIIERCSKKLAGMENSDYEIPISQQVNTLIAQASDPSNYVRHYPGWCPFW